MFPPRFVLASFTNSISEDSFTLVCRDIDLFLTLHTGLILMYIFSESDNTIGQDRVRPLFAFLILGCFMGSCTGHWFCCLFVLASLVMFNFRPKFFSGSGIGQWGKQ